MAYGLNWVVLIGKVVGDLRVGEANGAMYVKFRLAVPRPMSRAQREALASQDPQARTRPIADFINVIAWRRLAEIAKQRLNPGSIVAVVGSLRMRDWVDRNDNKRRDYEVEARDIRFIVPAPQAEAVAASAPMVPSEAGSAAPGKPGEGFEFPEIPTEDIVSAAISDLTEKATTPQEGAGHQGNDLAPEGPGKPKGDAGFEPANVSKEELESADDFFADISVASFDWNLESEEGTEDAEEKKENKDLPSL